LRQEMFAQKDFVYGFEHQQAKCSCYRLLLWTQSGGTIAAQAAGKEQVSAVEGRYIHAG
jgi:hypothetical protein